MPIPAIGNHLDSPSARTYSQAKGEACSPRIHYETCVEFRNSYARVFKC